jgi:hypothetical protein
MEKILTVILICFTLWSCDKFKSSDNPVVFEFQLLDEDGEQATEFSYEENFSFSFSIINNTEDRLVITEMYSMENFFEVFKIGDSGELVSFGKPYNAIFCEYVGGYLINSGDTFLVEIPWIPDPDLHIPILCGLKYDNTVLPVGNYQTSVSPTCSFQKGGEDFLTTTSSINISFQIIP